MKHQTRLQILEEIATAVAESTGKISNDIVSKAFLLQSEKKRKAITEQKKSSTRTARIVPKQDDTPVTVSIVNL